MHAKLNSLFDSDRADHAISRIAGTPEYAELRKRDLQRRNGVQSILCNEAGFVAIDFYHAAWILNHGDQPNEAEQAFQLAKQSYELGFEDGKWLYAAAFDRWRMYSGLPQKFGTQIVPDGSAYRLWDCDPNTTDEERALFNVSPMSELQRRAARESDEMAQPPMDEAPSWLRNAMLRWERQVMAEPSDAPKSPVGR